LSEAILKKIDGIDKKLNELSEFLNDVFITPEEHALLRETDEVVKKKNLKRLVSIDEL